MNLEEITIARQKPKQNKQASKQIKNLNTTEEYLRF